jgi:hypothetical protein
VDVVQDFIVTAKDCETRGGLEISSLIEGGEIIEHVGAAKDTQTRSAIRYPMPLSMLALPAIQTRVLHAKPHPRPV